MKTVELKRGDTCPNCGGELKPARPLSADEHRRIYDRENPLPVPYGVDTASPEQRADLGELFVCRTCGYKTRFAAESSASDRDRAANGAWETDAARGGPSGTASNTHDELDRLQRENADLKAKLAGGAQPGA